MKKAFTMLELVFVIVVIGILAALILPRTKTNPVQESAVDLLSKIRYTQHLALVDDQYDSTNSINDATHSAWYRNRWQISFNGNKYSVTRLKIDKTREYAKDPSNGGASLKDVDLNKKYNVTVTADCNGSSTVSFDYLGRPIAGDLSGATGAYSGFTLVQSNNCNITVDNGDENATISIAPETGYAKITF